MFIGHYGIGFMLKSRFREIPLWLYFILVQFIDLVAFILVFFGIEKAAYRESTNPFLRNELFLPYSHSLAGSLILSVLVYVFFIKTKNRTWAMYAVLAVFSHWIIDLMVHTPDLSIIPGSVNAGLGLWHYPWISYGLEIILVAAGWIILKYRNIYSWLLLSVLFAGFTGMIFSSEPELVRDEPTLRALVLLVSNIIFIILAYDSEKKQDSLP